MYLLDLPVLTAEKLLVIRKADAQWQPAWNWYDTCGMASPVRIQRVLEFGAGWLLQVSWQSWLATRDGAKWRIEVSPKWQGKQPDDLELSRTLGYLAALRVHDDAVHWDKNNGFHPRAGSLGLTKPEADYTLVWPDGAVRRIVVGVRTPFGRGVFMFTNPGADEHGNPHPRMLYLLEER